MKKKFYCPVNGWDCPYWQEGGTCSMVDDGDDPTMECDDAGYFWEDDIGNGTYFIWEDENGNCYETQELLEQGYHIVNDESVKPDFEKIAQEILGSPPIGMKTIKIRNPNWEG